MSMPTAAAPLPPPRASVAASLAELAVAMEAEWKAALSGGARRASGGGAEDDKGGEDVVCSAVGRCVRALADAADATAEEQTTADGGRPVDVRRASFSVFAPPSIEALVLSSIFWREQQEAHESLSSKKKKKKSGRRRRTRVGARRQAGSRRGASRPSHGRAVDLGAP